MQPSFIKNTTWLAPTGLSNPYLQWETTTKIQTGLELDFWGTGSCYRANYIRNRSSNQLIDAALSSVTGFLAIAEEPSFGRQCTECRYRALLEYDRWESNEKDFRLENNRQSYHSAKQAVVLEEADQPSANLRLSVSRWGSTSFFISSVLTRRPGSIPLPSYTARQLRTRTTGRTISSWSTLNFQNYMRGCKICFNSNSSRWNSFSSL